MGGKPSSTSTATQTSQPWGPQQPYLQDIFTNASRLYTDVTPQYYPGQTVAPMNPMQSAALQGIARTAATDPVGSTAANTAARFANGDFLWSNPAIAPMAALAYGNQAEEAPGNDALASYLSGQRMAVGNPYMGAVSDSVLAEVMPRIQSQFISSGMLSSPEAARASAAGATSALAPFAFGQYQQEEQNQINAANAVANRFLQGAGLQTQAAQNYGSLWSNAYGDMLRGAALGPSVQASQYAPYDALFSAGSAQQTQDQQAINDAVARWNFEQEMPFNKLNQYIGQVTGNYGGTTTLTQPYFSNSGQNALAGAVGGGTLGASLFPGMAAAGPVGAGLGALMMLFGNR